MLFYPKLSLELLFIQELALYLLGMKMNLRRIQKATGSFNNFQRSPPSLLYVCPTTGAQASQGGKQPYHALITRLQTR